MCKLKAWRRLFKVRSGDAEGVVQLRVIMATVGLMLMYILHDVLQEKAFRSDEFDFGWLMTTIELLVFASAASLFEGASVRIRPPPSVIAYFALLSLVLALSQGMGSAALGCVSFPVKVSFKSCKLIPTMLLGLFITGRRYSVVEYVAAVLMCVSLIMLVHATRTETVSDESAHEASTSRGVAMLVVAILCDAFVPNLQERILAMLKVRAVDMIMWTNLISGIGTLAFTIATGECQAAARLFLKNPWILFWLICQAVSGYCGLRCYLTLVRQCGAVVAVVATSLRKVFTLVLSFVLFSKPFTKRHLEALVLLQIGVLVAVWNRTRKTPSSKRRRHRYRSKGKLEV